MKKLNGLAAIDVGTTKVCTILADTNGNSVRVVGVGISPSRGMHKGMVVNIAEAREAIVADMTKMGLIDHIDENYENNGRGNKIKSTHYCRSESR